MKLKELRLERGLTQRQMVDLLRRLDERVDVPLYSKIESGLCMPTPKQLEQITEALECDISEIYDVNELFLLSVLFQRRAGSSSSWIERRSTKPIEEAAQAGKDLHNKRDYHRYKHRVCLRVNDYIWEALPVILYSNGFRTAQEWLESCLNSLLCSCDLKPATGKQKAPPDSTRQG